MHVTVTNCGLSPFYNAVTMFIARAWHGCFDKRWEPSSLCIPFSSADPYVKLALYCDGVRLSKANTRVKRRSLNPVFNEKFNFNVSADQISLTTVVLKIVNHSEINVGGGGLGTVILGFDSFGSGQEQWKSMIESPSRHIEKWHKLHKDLYWEFILGKSKSVDFYENCPITL